MALRAEFDNLNLPQAGKNKFYLSFFVHQRIPHICHGHKDGVRGEKIVMWRNFKFLYMTDEEKSKISPHVD